MPESTLYDLVQNRDAILGQPAQPASTGGGGSQSGISLFELTAPIRRDNERRDRVQHWLGERLTERMQEIAGATRQPQRPQPFAVEHDWEPIARRMRADLPDVGDPEEYRDVFARAANEVHDAAMFRRQFEIHRRGGHEDLFDATGRLVRESLGGRLADSPEEVAGQRAGFEHRIGLLPVAGGLRNIQNAGDTYRSAQRLAAGMAPEAARARTEAELRVRRGTVTEADRETLNRFEEDRSVVAAFLARGARQGEEGLFDQTMRIVEQIPGFALEFAATAGTFSAAREASRQAVIRALGSAAERTAGRVAAGVAGYAAGTLAQTVAMPQRIVQESANRAIEGIGVDPQGRVTMEDRGGPLSPGNLAAGFADTVIEVGSERAGDLLPLAGEAIMKLPRVGPALASIGRRWVNSAPGRTWEAWNAGIGNLANRLGHGAYHGVAGEMFEERVADVLRGITGLARRRGDGSTDWGPIGDILTGRAGEGGQQLLAESLAFAALPLGYGAARGANRAYRSMTDGPPAPGPNLIDIPPRPDWTSTFAERRAYVEQVREIAEMNAAAVRDWNDGAAGGGSGTARAADAELSQPSQINTPSAVPAATPVPTPTVASAASEIAKEPSTQPTVTESPGAAKVAAESASVWERMPFEQVQRQAKNGVIGAQQELKRRGSVASVVPSGSVQVSSLTVPQDPETELQGLVRMLRAEGKDADFFAHVAQRVREAGSAEAVAAKYKGDHLAAKYARAYAAKLWGPKDEVEPTAPTAATPGPSPGVAAKPSPSLSLPQWFVDTIRSLPASKRTSTHVKEYVREYLQSVGERIHGPEAFSRVEQARRAEAKKLTAEMLANPNLAAAAVQDEQANEKKADKVQAEAERAEARRRFRDRPLVKAVRDEFGINPDSVKGRWDWETVITSHPFMRDVFYLGLRKGRVDIDQMAELMISRGLLDVPAGRVAEDYLLEALANDRAELSGADMDAEAAEMERRHFEEMAAQQAALLDELESTGLVTAEERAAMERIKSGAGTPADMEAAGAFARRLTERVQQAQATQPGDADETTPIERPADAAATADNFDLFYQPQPPAGAAPPMPTQPTATPAAAAQPSVSKEEINARIVRDFNIKRSLGELMNRKAKGAIHYLGHMMIRARYFGSIPIVLHEAAHELDLTNKITDNLPHNVAIAMATLDYQPNRNNAFVSIKEGFAELIRMETTGDTSKPIPADVATWFAAWRVQHPEWDAKLSAIRSLVDQWVNQGATARGRGQFNTGQPTRPAGETKAEYAKSVADDVWMRLHKAWIDKGVWLSEYEKEAVKLGAASRPYQYWQFFKKQQYARSAIIDGVIQFDANGNMSRTGPGLVEAWKSLKDDADAANFLAYNLALQTSATYETGLPLADAKQIIAEVQADAERLARYTEVQTKWTGFHNGVLDAKVQAGLISQEDADGLKEKWKHYIPLLRVRPDSVRQRRGSGTINLSAGIKKRTGGDLEILDPFQGAIFKTANDYNEIGHALIWREIVRAAKEAGGLSRWVQRLESPVHQNAVSVGEVRTQLRKLLIASGFGTQEIDSLDADAMLTFFRPDFAYRGDQPIVRLLEDGKQAFYRIDKNLFDLLSGADVVPMSGIVRWLGHATSVLKAGAVTFSPVFAARNMIRDLPTYWISNKNAKGAYYAVAPFKQMLDWAWGTVTGRESDLIKLYKAMGGEFSHRLGVDLPSAADLRGELRGETSAARKALNIVKTPFMFMARLLESVEAGPRLAETQATLEKLGYPLARINQELANNPNWMPPLPVQVEVANAGSEVTVNFARSGNYGQQANMIWPFFNPNIQGMYKTIRDAKNNPVRAGVAALMLAGLAVAYWWTVKDEDWYQEQEPWLRNGFWTFNLGGKLWRIPKPHMYGVLISSMIEAVLNAAYKKSPIEVGRWAREAAGSLIPNVNQPAFFTPIAEGYFNYDVFRGRNIVPTQPVLERGREVTRTTTPEMSWLGEQTGISPARTQHVVSGLTGGAYPGLRNLVADPVGGGVEKAFGVPGEPSRSVNEFYERADALDRRVNTLRHDGRPVPEADADADRRNDRLREIMSTLRSSADASRRDEMQRYIIGLARFANGESPLERYPNPLTADPASLPAAAIFRARQGSTQLRTLAQVSDDFIRQLAIAAAERAPEFQPGRDTADAYRRRQTEHATRVRQATALIQELGVGRERIDRLLSRAGRVPR